MISSYRNIRSQVSLRSPFQYFRGFLLPEAPQPLKCCSRRHKLGKCLQSPVIITSKSIYKNTVFYPLFCAPSSSCYHRGKEIKAKRRQSMRIERVLRCHSLTFGAKSLYISGKHLKEISLILRAGEQKETFR